MRENRRNFTVSQLMQMDACTRCGECLRWCDAFVESEELTGPRLKLERSRSWLKGERLPPVLSRLLGGRKLSQGDIERLSSGVYKCTLCSRCRAVCPVKIDLPGLWLSLREELVGRGIYPKGLDKAREAVDTEHNVFSYPNDERATWVDFMAEAPEDFGQGERAEWVYFVGCIASFSPAVQSIAESYASLLARVGLNFTILGGEEWCCGYPLQAAGMQESVEELVRHNVEQVKAVGARGVTFGCPSCFKTWREFYQRHLPGVELLHSTQLLERLLREGKIEFKDLGAKVTYHDPCDLGRNSGVYRSPRKVINAIPGLDFIEVRQSGERGFCCGGGGDLEISDPDLANDVSGRTLRAIGATGAEIAVTACQQCKRMLVRAAEKSEKAPQILDIAELALKVMA